MDDEREDVMRELDDEMVLTGALVHRREYPQNPRRDSGATVSNLLALLNSPDGRLETFVPNPIAIEK
jgi:hypothetical protein